MKKKKIVVVGGGTGTSVVLEGLKRYPVDLTAIITTADDGSSSGMLRKEFGMVPPGDIRQCLVALASRDFSYLNERFQKGFLHGHTLGNLLITLFSQRNKNFQEAVDELLELVGAQGSLVPMTLHPVTLIAHLKDGSTLAGESSITQSRELHGKLEKLLLLPKKMRANPRAMKAITHADVVVIGPGNLYSSIVPVLLLPDITNALKKARAKKIYVANLFTQPGQTDSFTIEDYLHVLQLYIGKDIFSHILYNTKRFPESLVEQYRNQLVGEEIIVLSRSPDKKRLVGRALAHTVPKKGISLSDPIHVRRNPFLHDPAKLGKALIEIIQA